MTIHHDSNEPLFIQVAGHYNIYALDSVTLAKPCNENEVKFYQDVKDTVLLEHIPNLRSYHARNGDDSGGLTHCILIENLLAEFRCPSIMDVKLGRRYYGYNVSDDKKARMNLRSLKSTSHPLAIRICGIKAQLAIIDGRCGMGRIMIGILATLSPKTL
jgi:hypothetical protein